MPSTDPDKLRKKLEEAREIQTLIEQAGGLDKYLQLSEAIRRKIVEAGGPDKFVKQQEKLIKSTSQKLKSPKKNVSASSPGKSPIQLDIRAADAEYKPFPSFADWSRAAVDAGRWERHITSLKEWNFDENLLRRARAVVTRAAAIDTGALEQLYKVDQGFTFTVATQAAMWEAVLNKKGAEVRAMIETQMEAYELVLDFSTGRQPIAEAWIRNLHQEICRSQKSYTTLTEVGWQDSELPLGQYKQLPNHVLGRDGKLHSYAPVDMTPTEMHRFTEELRSDEFEESHPVLQASYAHYAFVCIHPFADGNGRVARALASVYTYRAESIPLLILVENRNEYISTLAIADEGNYQPFVDFVLERALDAIRMTEESLRGATVPALDEAIVSFQRLYITKGSYSQKDVDKAGYDLFDLMKEQFMTQLGELNLEGLIYFSFEIKNTNDYPLFDENNARYPASNEGRIFLFSLFGPPPERANLTYNMYLEVPKDCDREDDIIISCPDLQQPFRARMNELVPHPTGALRMRLKMFVQSFLSIAISRLQSETAQRMKTFGR
jgi:Fic family protein